MSDLEIAINASKKYEASLSDIFGAEGKGLHEKTSSVQGLLNDAVVSKLRFIASVRNSLVHDENVTELGKEKSTGFQDSCIFLDEYFSLFEEKEVDDSIVGKEFVTELRYIESYPNWHLSNAPQMLELKKAKEIIGEWERCASKRFIPTISCINEVNYWLLCLGMTEITDILEGVKTEDGKSRAFGYYYQFNWKEHLGKYKVYMHTTAPSMICLRVFRYISESSKSVKRIKRILIGINWDKDEVLTVDFSTPQIYKGVFGYHGVRFRKALFILSFK